MRQWWNKSPEQPSKPIPTFRQTFTLAQRVEKRLSLRVKDPEEKFCPTVIEGLRNIPTNSQNPKPFITMALGPDVTMLQLLSYVKKTMKVKENSSLFIQAKGTVPGMTTTVGDLSERFVSEDDGFIYLTVKTQDSF